MEDKFENNKDLEEYNNYMNNQYMYNLPYNKPYYNIESESQMNKISTMDDMLYYDLYSNNNNITKNYHLKNNLKFKDKDEDEFIDKYYNYKTKENNYQRSNNYSLDEDKKRLREEEKQKKLQYQQILDEQVREKRLREELEKERKQREDLFYEEKYRLEREEILKEEEKMKKTNLNNQNINQNLNLENDFEQKEDEFIPENINNNNNNNLYNNIYPQISSNNINIAPPTIENLVSTSTQIPFINLNRLNSQGYQTQNSYYSNYKINQYMTQNEQFYPPPQQKIKNSSSDIPINNFQMPYNQNKLMVSSMNIDNPSQSNQFRNNLQFNQNMNEFINIGKMMEIFFNEQNKIIEGYKETIKQLKLERDEAYIKSKANEEKLMALQNLQKCQTKYIKNYQFKEEYNQNMDNFLSTIQKDE